MLTMNNNSKYQLAVAMEAFADDVSDDPDNPPPNDPRMELHAYETNPSPWWPQLTEAGYTSGPLLAGGGYFDTQYAGASVSCTARLR